MKRALFTRQTAALSDDEGEYCELWLYDQAGKGQRLLDVEFRTITEARFAHAGDALAFVEATDSGVPAVLLFADRRQLCVAGRSGRRQHVRV